LSDESWSMASSSASVSVHKGNEWPELLQ
jgi:hypothetical protein